MTGNKVSVCLTFILSTGQSAGVKVHCLWDKTHDDSHNTFAPWFLRGPRPVLSGAGHPFKCLRLQSIHLISYHSVLVSLCGTFHTRSCLKMIMFMHYFPIQITRLLKAGDFFFLNYFLHLGDLKGEEGDGSVLTRGLWRETGQRGSGRLFSPPDPTPMHLFNSRIPRISMASGTRLPNAFKCSQAHPDGGHAGLS